MIGLDARNKQCIDIHYIRENQPNLAANYKEYPHIGKVGYEALQKRLYQVWLSTVRQVILRFCSSHHQGTYGDEHYCAGDAAVVANFLRKFSNCIVIAKADLVTSPTFTE